MGAFDPVTWETREAAIGPPAPEVEAFVDEFEDEVREVAPYEAVKTIHDALYEADVERTTASLAEPFVTAYLLEKRGIIEPDEGNDFRSIAGRRPDADRLRELFWERERTLWWIGVVTGVHPALVAYWCYEDGVPLMERNYSPGSMAEIRAVRESREG
jgi:hypothetical protein